MNDADRNGSRSRPALALALTASFTWLAPLASAQSPAAQQEVIMGFERSAGWSVNGNAPVASNASSTTVRTQGRLAYSLVNPANPTTLTSLPVTSTATALRGIMSGGTTTFLVDVMLPLVAGNPIDRGSLRLSVNSPSRRLFHEEVGNVDLAPFRSGVYTTIGFPIPDRVHTALADFSFSDLTFEFVISPPGSGSGTYLFDNLRVSSASSRGDALVTADASTRPPTGYGGSVDLVAIGNTPATALFDAAPIQVPDGFHLWLGTAGSTTVQLDLGQDGAPSFTCTYMADPLDVSGKVYKLISCTGGFRPGDLVGASWVRLTIVGGNNSMKLRAQLAKSPVGDLVGGEVIPAMPTYWGGFDGCVPVAVPNGVVPPVAAAPSASCAAQRAEANKIVTDYFNKVNNGQFPRNWVVTPIPESARRHGDASPHVHVPGTLATPDAPAATLETLPTAGETPPGAGVPGGQNFDEGGHVNEGGSFDAYWRMNGNFLTDNSNLQQTTSFDMNLSAHAVLFGQDVNVLSIEAHERSNSGQLGPGSSVSPSASGSLGAFVFGVQLYHKDVAPAIEFELPSAEVSDSFTVEASIWVFDLKFSANAAAGLKVHGSLSFAGADLHVSPHATIGLHAFGGIGVLGVISGGVEVTIPRLLDVNIDAGALLTWRIYTDPNRCGTTLDFQVLVTSNILSDGGAVNLVASFGVCPFCLEASHTIFSWGPIIPSNPKTLFEYHLSVPLIELPTSVCTAPVIVSIALPPPNSTFQSKLPVELSGSANWTNGNEVGSLDCKNLTWTAPGGTFIAGFTNKGCTTRVTFATAGQYTIGLSARQDFNSPSGTVTEIGPTASRTLTITPLPAGDYISTFTEPAVGAGHPGLVHTICEGGYNLALDYVYICFSGIIVNNPVPGATYGIVGLINDATQPTCTTWTALGPDGITKTIPHPNFSTGIPTADPSSITDFVVWTPSPSVPTGTHRITMTTANGACGSGGSPFASTQMTVTFNAVN